VKTGESDLIKGKKKTQKIKNNFIDKDEQTNMSIYIYKRGLF